MKKPTYYWGFDQRPYNSELSKSALILSSGGNSDLGGKTGKWRSDLFRLSKKQSVLLLFCVFLAVVAVIRPPHAI